MHHRLNEYVRGLVRESSNHPQNCHQDCSPRYQIGRFSLFVLYDLSIMLAFLDPKWGLILVCFHLFLFHHQQDNTCLWRVSPESPPELESFSRGDIGIWCNRSYTKARCEEFISLSGNTTWRRRFLDSR